MQEPKGNAIIDSSKLFHRPSDVPAYTLEEQCHILANSSSRRVEVDSESDPCLAAFCVSPDNLGFLFTPLEGSFCGTNNQGQCLRGTCIQHNVQLVNVATGKCLVPEKGQFAAGDKPILLNCSTISTQLLLGTEIERWGFEEIYSPTFMYSTNEGPDYKELRLSGDSNLIFDSRRGLLGSEWIIRRLSGKNRHEFVLQNGALGSCIRAGKNGTMVEVTSNCTGKEVTTVWKFTKVSNDTEHQCYHCLYPGFKWGYFQRIRNASWLETIVVCIFFLLLVIYILIWLKHGKSHRKSWTYIRETYVYKWIVKGNKSKLRKIKKK